METKVATIRKTITVTDQQDGWIKSQIDAGHYTNDSEIIRALIRREQEREQEQRAEIEAIRAALIEGENSGEPKAFDIAVFKQRVHAAHG
jgi:antitoxin ParD1/3/4